MRGTAEFQIIGRIGRIAEVGATLKVNVASDYPRRTDTGDWEDNTHWNTVTVFHEPTIARISEKMAPGDIVQIRGRVRNNSYEKDGTTHYTVELVSTDFNRLVAHQADPA